MPHTTDYLRAHYCEGNFTECALYRISKSYGKDKVPKYLYPNDTFRTSNSNLLTACKPLGGTDMLIKVIYPDGKLGTVRRSDLGDLVKMGSIAAYHCSEGWVELRRKRNIGYRGQERRVHNPVM